MGLSKDKHFINYYRVLNRACWSGLQASKILLGLLIIFIPVSFPIIIGIDDTIERRKGKKIKEANKRHKTNIDWSIQMMKQVKRWVKNRCIILIGDGGFSCIFLAHECIKTGVIPFSKNYGAL